MIFYEVKLDGLYQFKDFSIDFLYSRESIYSPIPQRHKSFPNLKFKKFAIILGANASGKTTFGKALCVIQNFLGGKDLMNIQTDILNLTKEFSIEKEKKITIESTFSTKNFMYDFKFTMNKDGIDNEVWKVIPLKNTSYNLHKEALDNAPILFNIKETPVKSFSSYFINNQKYAKYQKDIYYSMGFFYSFSGESDTIHETLGLNTNIFKKIAKSFDPSISDVTDSDEVPGNKIIHFKNGYKEIVLKNGTLSSGKESILSSGTKQSILLSHLLYAIYDKKCQTAYIDEKLTHTHSEIEQQIIQILISLIDRIDGQVFITSHNSDLINLKVPNYNFILFKKNKDGAITHVIEPEKIVKHQNRSIKKIIDEDIFGTSPILDSLIDLHDELIG